MKIKALVVAMGISLGLVACGGGSDEPYSDNIKVTAIDGLLQNANATAKCGTAQYAALTNANGVAFISKPKSVSLAQCFILITGTPDTIDTHTKVKFPGVFMRSVPNQTGDLIISPFTTLIAQRMTTTSNPETYEQAVKSVSELVGLTPAQITGDYTKDPVALLTATALATSNIWPKNENDFGKLLSGGTADATFKLQVDLISNEVADQIAALPADTDKNKVYITVNVKGTEVTSNVKVINDTNLPPVASFTSSISGLKVSFNGSGSSDADGTIASYAWEFGDDTKATGAVVDHTYSKAGIYNVKLSVTDNKGAIASKSDVIVVTTPTGGTGGTGTGGTGAGGGTGN